MTRRQAVLMADEQINWWRACGWGPLDAMCALHGHAVWTAEWWEVRAFMVDWLLRDARDVPTRLAA